MALSARMLDSYLKDMKRLHNLEPDHQPVPGSRPEAGADVEARAEPHGQHAGGHEAHLAGDRLHAGPTRDHLEAVGRFGYSPVHRRTFRPPSLFDTIRD